MQAPPSTSFIAASRHASALSSMAETEGPQHRTSSSISTLEFSLDLAPNDCAARVGSERPTTPLRAGGAVASANTFTYAPAPTSGADSVSLVQNSTSTARTKRTGRIGVLSALVSYAPPAMQNSKKPARARAPASAFSRLVQITFFLALVLFLHALSGMRVGPDVPIDPDPLDPNLELRRTGAMGARSRTVTAAYTAFRRAQAAPAHLHVDPEGHFTYSFSSAEVHFFPNIGTHSYWGRRTNVNGNANAGEEAEGVPEPTADSPPGDGDTVATSPWIALNVDDTMKKGIVRANDVDDTGHSSLPIEREFVPELYPGDSANAQPIFLPSSSSSPEHVITVLLDDHRDFSRMGRHRQQQHVLM